MQRTAHANTQRQLALHGIAPAAKPANAVAHADPNSRHSGTRGNADAADSIARVTWGQNEVRTVQGRGDALPSASRPPTPPRAPTSSVNATYVRPQPRAPSPQRSPSVRSLVRTAGLAALSLGGATLPSATSQWVPSLDLAPDATPITPLVDSAPLPREGEEPRYQREYELPVPLDFEWPRVEHFAFYDHTGNFPHAWSEIGWPGISVADRRASQQPPHD